MPVKRAPMRNICTLLLAASCTAVCASAAGLAFEVASIKKVEIGQGMGGGGRRGFAVSMTIDSGRVNCSNMSLQDLISTAYGIKAVLISGPTWMNTERFEINAKIPEGVKTDQVNEMLQTLLQDRFKLAVHKENKPTNVYALVVGKDGLKLKETVDPLPPDNGDPNGAPVSRNSLMRLQGMQPPPMMAPPSDSSRPRENVAEPSGPSIFSTVQRYGLRLDPRKEPIEFLIVDRLEKTPTEN